MFERHVIGPKGHLGSMIYPIMTHPSLLLIVKGDMEE